MSKIDTLDTLTTNNNSVAKLNANFTKIVAAMQNTLSLDGSTPNSLGADLDANSFQIINLPNPISPTDAVRKSYVDAIVTNGAVVSGNSPIGATSLLVFTSNPAYTTLAQADAAADGLNSLLVVDLAFTLSGDTTLNATQIMFSGGVINLNGHTLTINGGIMGYGQIFNTNGGAVVFSSNLIKDVWGEWFGLLPGLSSHLDAQLIVAMNAAGNRKVNLSGGVFKFNTNIQPSVTANAPHLVGVSKVNVWATGYPVAVINSTNYDFAPTAELSNNYTVFQIEGDGFWGALDGSSTTHWTSARINIDNIIFYGRTGSTVPFHFGQMVGSQFNDSAFIQFGDFGMMLRYVDTVTFNRCQWIDNGFNRAETGSLASNGASTYGSGCDILLGSKTTHQDYFGNGGSQKSTQVNFNNCTVWHRGNYSGTGFSGYRGVIGYNTGDCNFNNCQIVSSVLFVDCFGNLNSNHIETYQSYGTAVGSSADLWAAYFWDSSMTLTGTGWIGTQFQIHVGANQSDAKGWSLHRGGTYVASTGIISPGVLSLAPYQPTSMGIPSRFGDLGTVTVASITGGTSGTDTFTFPCVVQDGMGYHGPLTVSLSLSTNAAARLTNHFVVQAQKGASYSSAVSSNLATLTTFGANFGATITPSFAHTSGRQGLDLVITVAWTGSSWSAMASVDCAVCMNGGSVPST